MTDGAPADPFKSQRRPPPKRISSTPPTSTLSVGTRLWRIHSRSRPPAEFAATVPTAARGGRFDSPDGSYGVLYVSDSLEGAVAEVLLRDIPLVDYGARAIPVRAVQDKTLSVLETVRELEVVMLHGAGASAVGQGLWLTKSDSADYSLTRAWGAAIRLVAPTGAGFEWRARHDEDRLAFVLFGDLAEDALRVRDSLELADEAGLEAVRKVLLRYRAVIEA